MESFPRSAFKRNLEPSGDEHILGSWRTRTYVDLVSEHRYVLLRLKAPFVPRLDSGTVRYRIDAACALAPGRVPEVVDFVHDDAILELLIPWVEAPVEVTAAEIDWLVDTLAVLDAGAFWCTELGPEHLARGLDGTLQLLPTAYCLPPVVTDGAIDDDARPTPDAMRAHQAERLAELAGANAGGVLAALESAASAARPTRTVSVDDDATVRAIARVLPAVEAGGIVEVVLPAGSDGTRFLHSLRPALAARGASARLIDTWDLVGRKRRTPGKDSPWNRRVWLVDGADGQRLLHAHLLDYATGGAPGGEARTLVCAGDRPGALVRVLGGHAVPVTSLSLEDMPGASPPSRDGLDDRERQILELACVASVPLPWDLVASVFAGGGELHASLQNLAARGLASIDYRTMAPTGHVAITIAPASASVRRAVHDAMPEERRRNLHRTLARVAQARGGFPTMAILQHLLAADDATAAGYVVAFLRETTRSQRAPFLDELIARVTRDGLADTLGYGDRVFVLQRLGADLFESGRRGEAERLLTAARALPVDSEGLRHNAPLISETVRLLADVWAARGNYTPALDLLHDARDSLSPYLSLAEQAQLMNEIGWLRYRLGDYDGSMEACKLSLNTLNPNDHPLVVAQALNLMGVIHFNTSRYDEAISYYEQSAFLREKEGAKNALSGSYNNLALAYQSKGEYDKALDYYDKSLEIKREVENDAGMGAGYLNQALLYLEVHNFEEAERKCRESLSISTKLGLEQLTAEIHSTLGDIALTRGLHEEAESYYRKAIGIASSLETINEEMGARRRLAKLYLERGDHAAAREHIEEAERLGRQIGSKYESAQIASVLGDLGVAEGQTAEAIDHYEQAANLYAIVSKYRLAGTALANIGRVHAGDGKTLEARHYLDRALDLIKSEIGHEIPDEIVELQQTLRERPVRATIGATGSQKLLYAFYELSSLSEFADDKAAFLKRAITTVADLTGAQSCLLALHTPEGNYVAVRDDGGQEPVVDPGTRLLFSRALQLGTLLHSLSGEAADIVSQVRLPGDAGFVCIPMKSMGQSLGCGLIRVPMNRLPLDKDESNFITSIGRHIAGSLRLMLHLEEHTYKEKTLETEFESLKAQVVDRYRFQNMIGKDESMKKVFRTLEKVKDMDTGILIIGESGTGKTELARSIHYSSPRRKKTFQQIHCAEIPTSLLESELFGHEAGAFTGATGRKLGRCEVADGGTIFLDDVNVMPSETQGKLLHYLESKSFTRLGGTKKITTDVRIIAASNEDLEQLVKESRFREDLYYRLKVIQIELPPLRERKEDMMAIAQEFLKRRCGEQGKPLKTLSSETIKLFQRYAWPGNVRELQNVLEQIVLLSDDDILEPSSLPEDFLKKATGSTRHGRQTLAALSRQVVESQSYSAANPLMPQMEALLAKAMTEHTDSKGKAASLLGITKPTLYNRLRGADKLR